MTPEDRMRAYNMLEKARAVLEDLNRTTKLYPTLKLGLKDLDTELAQTMRMISPWSNWSTTDWSKTK